MRVTRWALALAAAWVFAAAGTVPAHADSAQFIGEWRNLDTVTRGLVRLSVAFEPNRVRVRAFSYCQPDACDLGWAEGHAYASSTTANLLQSADAIAVTFRERYAERLLILWPYERDRLKAELLTRFTDGSGRTNTREVSILSRTSDSVSGLSGGQSAPGDDCVNFDPRTIYVQRSAGDQWKVMEGGRPLLEFGAREKSAFRAEDVIKHYGMNRQCFLGRPTPAMEYYLVGDAAPTGWLKDEDCVGFAPARLAVKQLDGRWVVGEGDTVLVDTGQDRARSDRALGLIRRYGFSNLCYVGRPNPPMVYFRR